MLEELTERVENTSEAQTLVRLIGAEDQSCMAVAPSDLEWVAETAVLSKLIDRFAAFRQHHPDLPD